MSNVFSSVVWSRLMYEEVQRKFLENSIKICLKFDQIIFQGSNQVGWRGRVVVELELRLTIIRFTFGFVYIRIYMPLNITKFSCESFNGSQSGDLRVHNPSPSSRACLHTWFSYMFNEEIANKKMMKTSSLLHAHLIRIDSIKKLQTKKWWKVVLCCMRTQSFTCQEVGEEQKLRRGRRAGQEPDV